MINPIAFTLGPLEVWWYGIIMASAFSVGAYLAYHRALLQGVNQDHILNLIIIIMPAAIIGARLYYVVFSWQNYIDNPVEIISIWHGGLAIHGGILGGVIAGVWYIKKHNLNPFNVADIIAPSLILGQAIGRWGNFINQEAHGGVVSEKFISLFPNFIKQQMYINGQYYHPTFLYESLWNFAIFLFLTYYWSVRKKPGEIAALYLVLYSFGRFIIEGLRTDSLMLGSVKVAQLVSFILIVSGIIIFYIIRDDKFRIKK